MPDTDIRSTPQELFDRYNELWHFTLDVAANRENRKCNRWYGPGGEVEDALSVDWPTGDFIWMNPPYSRGLQRQFVEKAINCARRGGFVIGLLPADTSTKLFHELLYRYFPIVFLKGRSKFNDSAQGAKFGSMIVRFDCGT